MSGTRRYTQPGWELGEQEFDRWNDGRPNKKRIRSKKHQQADRPSRGKEGGKFGRFSKHGKNSLYNLRGKNDDLYENEQY